MIACPLHTCHRFVRSWQPAMPRGLQRGQPLCGPPPGPHTPLPIPPCNWSCRRWSRAPVARLHRYQLTARVPFSFAGGAANNGRQSSQGAWTPPGRGPGMLSGHMISPLKRPARSADILHKRGLYLLPAPVCRPGSMGRNLAPVPAGPHSLCFPSM